MCVCVCVYESSIASAYSLATNPSPTRVRSYPLNINPNPNPKVFQDPRASRPLLVSPFPEDLWAWWLLMHWLQLQFTPCEALPSVWISFAWQYSQACGHPCCLCTLSYPISSFQSTLHLICFDTALLEQPPLSVMTLCDLPSLWRVSMIIFWTIAKSAVFPIIVVSKN